nr:hypothetical protein Itr_chr15CG10630 [Ipomoea trifida]
MTVHRIPRTAIAVASLLGIHGRRIHRPRRSTKSRTLPAAVHSIATSPILDCRRHRRSSAPPTPIAHDRHHLRDANVYHGGLHHRPIAQIADRKDHSSIARSAQITAPSPLRPSVVGDAGRSIVNSAAAATGRRRRRRKSSPSPPHIADQKRGGKASMVKTKMPSRR